MPGFDMPSLMLPSFPDLPYCALGWAGAREVGEVLEAHLAPTSSWHIPPAQETEPGVMTSSHPTPRDTKSQGASRPAGISLPAAQDHSVHAPRERETALPCSSKGSCPFLGQKKQIPTGQCQDACLFSGALAGMLGAERAMGSLWSPFPAFYPSGVL